MDNRPGTNMRNVFITQYYKDYPDGIERQCVVLLALTINVCLKQVVWNKCNLPLYQITDVMETT